ncbi:DUF1272 domain-containing protein [Parasphingorhabdus pacifica]
MRALCERCSAELPGDSAEAYICSYECTFCARCTGELSRTCPNCGGVLERRPIRAG